MIYRYFVDTGEGIEYHETEQAARESADANIDGWKAYGGNEWPEEVKQVCWGVVIERATGNMLTCGRVDYKMQKVPE